MGIAYKDLKVGSFYKGYHQPAPTGLKCFYYVTQSSHLPGQNYPAMVEVTCILRHQPSATTWSPLFVQQGLPDAESLLKQEVRISALHAENINPPLQYTPRPTRAPVTPQAPVPPHSINVPYVPTATLKRLGPKPVSEEEAAIAAKAARNKGKTTIPENAHSPRCVKCHGANRSIALFQFTSYYCEQCEPT